MIYYFSGTGNSRFAAEKLAEYTKDTALFIPDVMERMQSDITVQENETAGVVFPVYAWAPPAVVMDFLSHVHADKKAFTFAVCTCGDEAGKAMDDLHRVFAFKSAYSLAMPNNYIPLFDVDEPELEREKINVASQRLPKIASEISARREQMNVHEGPEAAFKTVVLNPLFSMFGMRTSKFSADAACNGCGLCVTNCPFHVIVLENGKPVWKEEKCAQCMSCIMRCPKRAIQYGIGTKNRGRYVFPSGGKNGGKVIRPGEDAADQQDAGSRDTVCLRVRDSQPFPGLTVRYFSDPGNREGERAYLTELHIAPGASLPSGAHEARAQILYGVKGSAKLTRGGAADVTVSEGSAVRLAGGTAYALVNTGTDEFVAVCSAYGSGA